MNRTLRTYFEAEPFVIADIGFDQLEPTRCFHGIVEILTGLDILLIHSHSSKLSCEKFINVRMRFAKNQQSILLILLSFFSVLSLQNIIIDADKFNTFGAALFRYSFCSSISAYRTYRLSYDKDFKTGLCGVQSSGTYAIVSRNADDKNLVYSLRSELRR